MPALKVQEYQQLLQRGAELPRLAVFWGEDTGQIRRLFKATLQQWGVDPQDPFIVDRLTFRQLAEAPSCLLEAAQTLALAGRRVVLLDDGLPDKDDLAQLAAALMVVPSLDDLAAWVLLALPQVDKAEAAIRAVEKLGGVSVHCKAEQTWLVEKDIDALFSSQGQRLGPGVLDLLKESLARDSALARTEVAKIQLYTHGKTTVYLEDVLAVLAAAPSATSFKLAEALGRLEVEAADQLLGQLLDEGEEAPKLLGALYNHLQKLENIAYVAQTQRVSIAKAVAQLMPKAHVFVQKKIAEQAQVYAKGAGRRGLPTRFYQIYEQLRVVGLPERVAIGRALISLARAG